MKKVLLFFLLFVVCINIKANNGENSVDGQHSNVVSDYEIVISVPSPTQVSDGTIVMQHKSTGQSYTFSNTSDSSAKYYNIPQGTYRVTSVDVAKCSNGFSGTVRFVGQNTVILSVGSSIDLQSGGAITFVCL